MTTEPRYRCGCETPDLHDAMPEACPHKILEAEPLSENEAAHCPIHGNFYAGYIRCPVCHAMEVERMTTEPDSLRPIFKADGDQLVTEIDCRYNWSDRLKMTWIYLRTAWVILTTGYEKITMTLHKEKP